MNQLLTLDVFQVSRSVLIGLSGNHSRHLAITSDFEARVSTLILGYELTPLRRMTAAIGFAGLAWIVVGTMQLVLDHGNVFTIAWQVPLCVADIG